jgi:hypothetical protein
VLRQRGTDPGEDTHARTVRSVLGGRPVGRVPGAW